MSGKFNYLKALLLAAICIYIVVRVGENTFSWKKAPGATAPSPQARLAGEKYAGILRGAESNERKIKNLWQLTTTPVWHLSPEDADPQPLAADIARRARAYYTAGNIPQAASHNKILLDWAHCLMAASGSTTQRLNLAGIAIKSVSACPSTLRYPAIRDLTKSLAQSLSATPTRMDDLLNEFSQSETGDGPRNILVLANRNVLKDSLTSYLASSRTPEGTKKMKLGVTAKSWLLVCPLTEKLYRQSLEKLEPEEAKARSLREEINSLLGSSPATIELPG